MTTNLDIFASLAFFLYGIQDCMVYLSIPFVREMTSITMEPFDIMRKANE